MIAELAAASPAELLQTLTPTEKKALRLIREKTPVRVRNGWAAGSARVSLTTYRSLIGSGLVEPQFWNNQARLGVTAKGRAIALVLESRSHKPNTGKSPPRG